MSLPIRPTAKTLLSALLCVFLIAVGGKAEAPVPDYEWKAAALPKFAQFVKWPPQAFPNPTAPITIGVLGDDPVADTLPGLLPGETVGKRKLAMKRSRQADDLKGCQIVFICRSEKSRLAGLLSSFQTNVLTVSDIEHFTSQGGIIGFKTEGSKVRFEINNDAAKRAGLEIKSGLLKMGS